MQRRHFVTSLALSAFIARPALADTPPRIVLSTLVGTTDGFVARWLDLIYTDAFQRLGVALEIRAYPAARAAAEAAAGKVDGELCRSFDYVPAKANLLRVDEPAFHASIGAYAKRPEIHLKPGWRGLRDSPYRIEYRFGYAIIPRRLATVIPAEQTSGTRDAVSGLRKLIIGRSDVYVDFVDIVDTLLASPEFRNSGVHQVAVMERSPFHTFLNKKHAELVPRLSQVLKKMRDSGQIERYRQQALKELSL
ncbi:hypothetical protein GTP45_17445 [Pseudoduganella sp. FT55W]|uniref:Transporter substrate-binding domain-containing protein n=1 Tax=Duganella rivi TaxID=2666083 RepID=A0A7X4KCW3_9BURK|nr:hypothetical protein [Duganella rivi]MYM68605.1 hypothetical protein [Duganella rivi]